MPNSSVEMQLGKLLGQQEMILRELSEASRERRHQAEAVEDIKGTVHDLNTRMITVEQTLVKFEPTIEEFLTIKRKVAEAGKMGRWLWIALIALIGLVLKFKLELASWFAR